MPLRTLKPLGARACRTGCLAPPIRQPKVSVAARVRIDAVAVAGAVALVELAGHPDFEPMKVFETLNVDKSGSLDLAQFMEFFNAQYLKPE